MQTTLTSRIREEAARLLFEGKVDVVIGFELGSLPLRSTPCFVRDASDAGRLVWNSFCGNNLSRYIHRCEKRIGLVAKGCDTRAIIELIKEKQVQRENLVIIGVPCRGMVDAGLVRKLFGGGEILSHEEAKDGLLVTGALRTLLIPWEECLHQGCRVCMRRNPVIHDVLAGGPLQELPADSYRDVSGFAESPPDERWARITGEMDRCIRCYACRDACPLCYCANCFVDATMPQWVGKSTGGSDTLSFHLMRSLHLAGRCVECGACERACPMGVDIRALHRKVSSDVAGMFGYTPGMNLDEPAPLSRFEPDDPEDFMTGRSPCAE
jgi:ferredoxin